MRRGGAKGGVGVFGKTVGGFTGTRYGRATGAGMLDVRIQLCLVDARTCLAQYITTT